MSKNIVKELLDNKIYVVDLNRKVKFASGIESNVYCDNRKILNYPKLYKRIAKQLSKLQNKKEIDAVVGTATAGIPWAALVGVKLKKPTGYVRLKPKDHGTKKLVEGCDVKDKTVLLIEDLITTGESVLKAAKNILNEGAKEVRIISIFSYDFGIAKRNFKKYKLNYKPLFHFQELANEFKENNQDVYSALMIWWKKHK